MSSPYQLREKAGAVAPHGGIQAGILTWLQWHSNDFERYRASKSLD